MLYVFTGDDFTTIQNKKSALIDTLQTKRPNAQQVNLQTDTPGVIAVLEEQINSVGLFDTKSIITAYDITTDPDMKAYLINHAKVIQQSDNAFVLYETSLSKKDIDALSKAGATIHQHNLSKGVNRNMFYLADLLTSKRKSQLWAGIQTEFMQGVRVEELYGIMVFQARALHLATTHKQDDTDLKPFVYTKASRSSWTAAQAQSLHFELVQIYHQSRRGGLNLHERLERLILNIPK